jgi:hypothetical protein
MATPADPTVAEIVTEGLKRGGRISPSSTDITNATNQQFREVKSDIVTAAGRSNILLTTLAAKVARGVGRVSFPTDADDVRSLQVIYGDPATFFNSTAQAGGANTITLNASFSQSEDDLVGRAIFLIAGTGVGGWRHITAYDNGTKVATVDSNWVTNPASGTEYVIEMSRFHLYPLDRPTEWSYLRAPWGRSTPTEAAVVNREVYFNYVPDRTYGLFWDYWVHLDRIDEAGTMMVRHLREYRSLWVQGIAVKTMQRYDEDRYAQELAVYTGMLRTYGGRQAQVAQIHFTDV